MESQLFAMLLLTGCGVAAAPVAATELPTATDWTVVRAEPRDGLCYITLSGKEGDLVFPSHFKRCFGPNDATLLVGKSVRATFNEMTVDDCESNLPCGKSRVVISIVTLEAK